MIIQKIISLIRATALLLTIVLASVVSAKDYEKQLAQMADSAREKMQVFFDSNGKNNKLGEYLSSSVAKTILASANYDKNGKWIENTEIYSKIANELYGENKVAFYAAAVESAANATQRTEYYYLLMQALVGYDAYAAPFVFEHLEKERQNFSPELEEKYSQLISNYGFYVNGFELATDSGDFARICVNFSLNLRSQPEQDWQRLITIKPQPQSAAIFSGDAVCYLGKWQTDYSAHIDGQLQSYNKLKLEKNSELELATGGRSPSIRFENIGNTMLLEENAGLGIVSVNIDRVGVRLWRVSTSNLSQEDIDDAIYNPQWLNYYNKSSINNAARLIYEGNFAVADSTRDENSIHKVKLSDMGVSEGGIYIANIYDKDRPNSEETNQYIGFALSDAGFSAYVSDDGLWVELRDLQHNLPLKNREVILYSADNEELARATSDAQGMAAFDKAAVSGKGGARIDRIISGGKKGLAYLKLSDREFDLSNKGLSSRASVPPVTTWTWLQRGIYRPGETMHALWLLRDGKKAFKNRDLWLNLKRPDGSTVHEGLLKADESGAYSFSYEIPHTARLGNWYLNLSLGKDNTVLSTTNVIVDAVLPESIETKLSAATAAVDKQQLVVDLQADWLYGKPAVGIDNEGHYRLRPRAMAQFKEWQIGNYEEESSDEIHSIERAATDATGKREIVIDDLNSENSSASKPYEIDIASELFSPDGLTVRQRIALPIERNVPYIALKANDKQASVIAFDDSGKLQSQQLNWKLYHLEYSSYWSNDYGEWNYHRNKTKTFFKEGNIATSDANEVTLQLPVDDGNWMLSVSGDDERSSASIELAFGKSAYFEQSKEPDGLTITSNKERYEVGEEVLLNIRAPFNGVGSIKLAQGAIFETRQLKFENYQAKLSLKWKKDWEEGLWLLASAWDNDTNSKYERRAVGLHWLGQKTDAFALTTQIDSAQVITPNGVVSGVVSVANGDDDTWVNIAIVDEGLYRLAAPTFSDPLAKFYGKRPWALSFFDVWGEVIAASKGRSAILRSGAGDDYGYEDSLIDLPTIDTPLISYWSQPQRLKDGKVQFNMELPHFNGRLRVMALAYNDHKSGIAEKEITVRENIVSRLYNPPYLSVGDNSNLRLRLHNTTAQAQHVDVLIDYDESLLTLANNAQQLELAANEEKWLDFAFNAQASGKAVFGVTVNDASWQRFINIRDVSLPKWQSTFYNLQTNETVDVPLGGKYSIGSLAVATQDLVQKLYDYPYSCSEQSISRLRGALYDKESDRAHQTIVNLQSHLINLQQADGAFSLWGKGYDSDLWLTAYIGDVLLEARDKGQLRQEVMLEKTLNYLRNYLYEYANYDSYDFGAAYAYYVLAKDGQNVRGAIINYVEQLKEDDLFLDSEMLHALLALYSYGEENRAKELFARLKTGKGQRGIYQSLLAEYALRAVRLHELATHLDVGVHLANAEKQLATQLNSYLSTQEMSWLLPLSLENKAREVEIDGSSKSVTNASATAQQALTIRNKDALALQVSVTQKEKSTGNQLIENGYSVNLFYKDGKGAIINPENVDLYQDIYVVVMIKRDLEKVEGSSNIIFAYPYTAGEKSMTASCNDLDSAMGVDFKEPSYSENRDDRHIAAFYLSSDEDEIYHCFSLRSMHPGNWHAPGYFVQDMYFAQFGANYPQRTQKISTK